MFRLLLSGTSIVALATPLAAQTVIDDERTMPVITSELNAGQGDDLVIAEAGSITLADGTAVTIDSDNDVDNEGEIVLGDGDGATGISVEGDRTANISNSGTITITEDYEPEDADDDGDLDGPFALASNRAAILVDGALTGNIAHSGEITVEGNDSSGIFVNGPLTGDLIHDGETNVVGDGSVGVSLGDVAGDVRLAGTIEVQGEGAVGALMRGEIEGGLVIQGDISASGYRETEAPADTSNLDADDLLQGGSAVLIEGNVTEGVIFAVAPADADPDDNDEDDDGIPDAAEGDATITSFGKAPAVVIGSAAENIQIGAGDATGSDYGIVVDGEISGQGVYTGMAATGMQIGGRGGRVTVDQGMLVNGTIEAVALDASATALRIGTAEFTTQNNAMDDDPPLKTSIPELHNTGMIEASSTGDGATLAMAVAIEESASVPVLRNSGSIKASTGAVTGSAYAIIDNSGSLGLVENTGLISASGADADSNRNVAIDLSQHATGAIVRQLEVAANVAAPEILGDIRFGDGDDRLELVAGSVVGDTDFGDGVDRLLMSGDATYTGDVSFGGQADVLSLSDTSGFVGSADFGGGDGSITMEGQSSFFGRLVGTQNTDMAVSSGTLDVMGNANLRSLDIGEDAVLVVNLDGPSVDTTRITVSGPAQIEEGATLRMRVTDVTTAVGSYDVLTANTLVGGDGLTVEDVLLPFIYDSELSATDTTLTVDVDRKEASELGLNRSGAAAFDAIYEALGNRDEEIADVFLAADNAEQLSALVSQMLPDHAGGAFEGISRGLRTLNRHFMDPQAPFESENGLRLISDLAYWDTSKDARDTAPYQLDGYGIRAGLEATTGIGAFGITTSYLWNDHDNGLGDEVSSGTFEVGAHWRHAFGPVSAFARGAFGWARL